MQMMETTCPLDCPDSCSLEVGITDGRVQELAGTRRNPLTQGFICSKVRRFPQHLYGSERILHPAGRKGSKGGARFSRLGWEEALDRVVERLRSVLGSHGGEAVLPLSYGGSNGYLSHQSMDRLFFHRLGASRLARTVCAAPSSRAAGALYGKMAGVSLTDYRFARLIVVWGANPSVSGIHHVPVIREARQKGARLVVIDPRRTPLAKEADLHLAPQPGTDLPIALSLIRWLFQTGRADLDFLASSSTGWRELQRRAQPWSFEQAARTAGVGKDELADLARLYAESSPAVIRCGWGMERNRNGGSAVAAVLALPAVAGKFKVRGGGYTMSNAGAWDLPPQPQSAPATRVVNMNRIGRVLENADPPVKFLFVYNCNPLATLPAQERLRRGLQREDLFTVVFDSVLTDTARYADLLLPATTFLEHEDLVRGYGAMAMQEVRPVIAPVGESRSNYDVFARLARRMNLLPADEEQRPGGYLENLLSRAPFGEEIRRQLQSTGIARPESGSDPVQFVDLFPPTAEGKIQLLPESLDREAPSGLYGYQPDPASRDFPLALISPSTNRTICSTLGELYRRQVPVELHPIDAARRNIQEKEEVVVFNSQAEVRCQAKLNPDLKPGVVLLPKGLWSHNTLNGRTANALVPDTLTDLGGGACFNDARVQVRRA
ncbi:MAG: molybdopterin-dependent oxidoreductase [Acidobacteriota bacterium]